MAASVRSVYVFWGKAFQRLFHAAIMIAVAWFLILFALQFKHPHKIDAFWLVEQLRQLGNPVIEFFGSWLKMQWPSPSPPSFLPVALAILTWIVKYPVDRVFTW